MLRLSRSVLFVVVIWLCNMSLCGADSIAAVAPAMPVVPVASAVPQFSYNHATEIAYNNEPGFKLDSAKEQVACFLNRYLSQSAFFDPSFIANPVKMREYHLKKKPATQLTGKLYDVFTDDDVRLGTTFFDRGSDTLLIVAAGFTNEREVMSPFVAMFPDYDVALFDFRGHGYRPFAATDPNTWPVHPVRGAFGIDGDLVKFGHDEDKDVTAVIDGFMRLKTKSYGKTYKRVMGLGVCYGAFVLLKTAAENPNLFDRLVLDGCWLSLSLFVEKAKRDLKTLVNPQTGGWSNHWCFGRPWVQDVVEWITKTFVLDLTDISLLDYTHKIKKTPLLFFYGKDDYMIRRSEFEQLWNSLKTEKTVVVTSNPHVRNHLKQKELYKLICDLFFEHPQSHFISCLRDEDTLADMYVQKMQQLCGVQPNGFDETMTVTGA